MTLKPSPRKWLGVLAISAVFIAIGILLIETQKDVFWGWTGTIFFGACGLGALYNLIPGANYIIIDANGFEVFGLRLQRLQWPDANNFAIITRNAGVKFVVFDDLRRSQDKWTKINRFLIGRSAQLPDTYGLRAEDLSLLMTLWRERALKRSH